MAIMKMTKTIILNLFKKPVTRFYPFSKREPFPNTRGKIVFNMQSCVYCSLCQRRCPTGAITVGFQDKTWSIDSTRCITCAYCVEVCPKKCLCMDNQYTPPSVVKVEESFENKIMQDKTNYWE